MADVARLAGVSDMTVSNAYKRPDRVADDTRKRVFEAARQLGYVLNEVAGNLASGRSKVIAAVVPSLSSSYFHATLQGTMDGLREHGYRLMLADSGYGPADEETVVEAFLRRRPDGFLLTGTRHTRRAASLLRAAAVPVVETWEVQGPFIDMAVGYSNSDAAAALTQLLIRKGHRRIGYIDHPEAPVRRHRQRREGIRAVLRDAGLPSDRVVFLPEVMGFAGGRVGLQRLLASWPDTTAVIAATDVYAAAAVFECQRRGMRVPDDLAVCGFGNAEVGRETCPALTTVDTRSYGMGRAAAQALLARLAGRVDVPAVTDVGFEVIERQST
jgi:LacI family gluconate utilization system Gnt-I transcriptional repressor